MSEQVDFIIKILTAFGSILSGVVMLITLIQLVSRIKYKTEVIYGAEAKRRYENIKTLLSLKGVEIGTYEYEGGENKKIPRLEFEKCNYNPITMDHILKWYKKRVCFIDDEKIVHTWYLK